MLYFFLAIGNEIKCVTKIQKAGLVDNQLFSIFLESFENELLLILHQLILAFMAEMAYICENSERKSKEGTVRSLFLIIYHYQID